MRSAGLPALVIGVVWAVFFGPLRATPIEHGLSVTGAAALAADVDGLIRSDRLAEAIPGLETLLARNGSNDYYVLQLARAYSLAQRPTDAIPLWQRFMDRSPVPLEACPEFPRQYEALGQREAAMEAFERCLALEPANTDNAFHLARSYERAARTDDALAIYRKFAAAAPEYLDFAIGAARLELRAGDVDGALARMTTLVTRHPDNSDALLVLGMARELSNDLSGAAAALERGVAVAPGDLDFYLVLGRVAEKRRRPDEARRWYAELVTRDPSSAAGREGLARVGGGE